MIAKLVYLFALTLVLAAVAVLLIMLHPTELPQLTDTVIGALLSGYGVGVHAIFREPSSPKPTTPAEPAKE